MSTILLVVILILIFGGGGGYYAHGRYGGAGSRRRPRHRSYCACRIMARGPVGKQRFPSRAPRPRVLAALRSGGARDLRLRAESG
jgi:hypothetical protein